MPLPPKASDGYASLMVSDSEPDFDDVTTLKVPLSRGNDQKTSMGNNRRQVDSANRVTKSAGCLARSHNGVRRVGHLPTTREISTTKSNHGSFASAANGTMKPPEQCTSHNNGALADNDGWSQHNSKSPRRAKDKSEYTGHAPRFNTKTTSHDHDMQPRKTEPNPDATEPAMGSQEIVCDRDIIVSKPIHSRNTDDFVVGKQSSELRERYHALEARHTELREVGIKAGERNFERLKRQSMETAAASTTLINQLKAELAVQSDVVKQNEQLERQLQHSQASVVELERTVTDLTASLSRAKSEIQSLSAKIGAIRAAEVANKAPANMTKTFIGGGKSTSSGALLAAQAKEDLYSDLTGLIVRGTGQINGENVFDCIQTGRNGTLHFKLALEAGEDPEKYDEVQFTYRPQLNEERDHDLVQILPDYLVEEITFTRTQASNFYSKLNKSLTERLD
ncbi:hypothetical protein E4U42_000593 [Claviceps africana]|uniref:Monopolin complex subunit Csm1/Pcs1 C-terminal domain-containing protein n=1 Tax=Claviceps africana TaxID=83212 RepID=A0A8K0JA39_9HYPO|nr:hypothetical protein E4U42_000593 [Claviceps africana]